MSLVASKCLRAGYLLGALASMAQQLFQTLKSKLRNAKANLFGNVLNLFGRPRWPESTLRESVYHMISVHHTVTVLQGIMRSK